MSITAQLAKHFRDVHYGGNWTTVNLKDTLADVTWEQATRQVNSFNTIATLVYHVNYYVGVVMKVLNGQPLDAKDEYSFNVPLIQSQSDWNLLLERVWKEADEFAIELEKFPEEKLWETFIHEKYGTYYRNIQGIIEHYHYHLGQIVLIKKLFKEQKIKTE